MIQKKAREPWIEYALKAWGKWVKTTARWTGYGGGVDKASLIEQAGWGRSRNPGTYSDPTCAEVMAALWDRQGPHQRLHAEILGLPATERRVLVARYCGQPVPRRRPGSVEDLGTVGAQFDVPCTDEKVKVRNRLAVERRLRAAPFRGNVCWIEWEWSGGPLPFATVGQLVGMSTSGCHEALERAKLRLLFRLEVRDAIRDGQFDPAGGMLQMDSRQKYPEVYERIEREKADAAS